jgi:hypothetical protein
MMGSVSPARGAGGGAGPSSPQSTQHLHDVIAQLRGENARLREDLHRLSSLPHPSASPNPSIAIVGSPVRGDGRAALIARAQYHADSAQRIAGEIAMLKSKLEKSNAAASSTSASSTPVNVTPVKHDSSSPFKRTRPASPRLGTKK